jgi:tetratricopeptide (TPR) repeat protein
MSQNNDNPIADVDFSLWNIGSPGGAQSASPKVDPSPQEVDRQPVKPEIDVTNWSLNPGVSAHPEPVVCLAQSQIVEAVPSVAPSSVEEVVSDPETVDEWIVEGEAAYGDADLLEAERCFQGALRLNPINAIALSNLGVVHHTGGKLDVAERFYLKATAFDPTHADSYFGLAQLWCDNGNQGLALRYAARGLQRAPNHSELVELATALSQSIDAQLSELRPS